MPVAEPNNTIFEQGEVGRVESSLQSAVTSLTFSNGDKTLSIEFSATPENLRAICEVFALYMAK